MERRNFLVGIGGVSIGGSALLGTGAFSRVESQRDVTIAVAEDPDAYLGLSVIEESLNSTNYVDIDGKGHIWINVGENPNGGVGVNSDSFSWFDNMIRVCNQGKEGVGFYIEEPGDDDFPNGIDATGPAPYDDEPRLQFYTGEAAGVGDDGTSSVMGEANAVDIPVGECIELGMRTMTKGVNAFDGALFREEVRLIADVDVTGDVDQQVFPVRNRSTRQGYPTIQAAVDEADEDDAIDVAPGEYDESVVIRTAGLTLEGPNAGLPGDSENRGSEAVITGGVRWTNRNNVTVDGFEVTREVGDGNGVFELGSGNDARIGENAVIRNNVIDADPLDTTRMSGVLFEGDLADELFVQNNLITQQSGDKVEAVTHFESEIGTLEITDNIIDTQSAVALGGGNSDITAEITDNVFTDSFASFPAIDVFESDAIQVDIQGNRFDGAVAGVRVGTGVDVSGVDGVGISDNEFIADGTVFYVRDSGGSLDLNDILNNQGNTFDPNGEVDGNQIVPE